MSTNSQGPSDVSDKKRQVWGVVSGKGPAPRSKPMLVRRKAVYGAPLLDVSGGAVADKPALGRSRRTAVVTEATGDLRGGSPEVVQDAEEVPVVTRQRRGGARTLKDLDAFQIIGFTDLYATKLASAKLALNQLSASRFIDSSRVGSTIGDAVNLVASGKTVANYKLACEQLDRVLGLAESAAREGQAAINLANEVDRAIQAAEATALDLGRYPFLASGPLQLKAKEAREAFAAAVAPSGLQAARSKLDGFTAEAATLREGGKKSFKAHEEYVSARKAAGDRLHEAGLLRGATSDGRVSAEVEKLRAAIRGAEASLAMADTPAKIVAVRKRLEEDGAKALAEAKVQSALVRAEFDESIAALPAYIEACRKAQDARDRIATMLGATTQLQAIDGLIARTRTASNGAPPAGGLAAASRALEAEIPGLLVAAEAASKEHLSEANFDPAVLKAREKADAALLLIKPLAPDYLIRSRESELSHAVAIQGKDAALAAIAELEASFRTEAGVLAAQKELATELVGKLKEQLASLDGLKVPAEATAGERKALKRAEEVLLARREYEEASLTLDAALEAAKSQVGFFEKNIRAWDDAEAYINQSKSTCGVLLKWPAAAGEAGRFNQELLAEQARVRETRDYEAAIAWLAGFKPRFSTFEQSVVIPPGEDLEAFNQARNAQDDRVREAARLARLELQKLEAAVGATGANTQSAAHENVRAAMDDWSKYFVKPAMEGDSKTMTASLIKHADATVALLGRVGDLVEVTLGDPDMINWIKGKAKEAEAASADAARPGKVLAMIETLEALRGPSEAHRAALKKYNEGAFPDDAARAKHLADLEAAVQVDLDGSRKQLEDLKKEAARVTAQFSKERKALAKKNKPYLAYYEGLEARLQDARGLLEGAGDDLELVVNACKLIRAVGVDMERTKTEDGKASAYDAVDAKITAISNALGQENVVRHHLKVTYGVLYQELQDLVAEARALPPEEGAAKLATLGQKVDAAVIEAGVAKQRSKAFDARCERIEETGKLIAKETRTRVTDRCEAYYAIFQTRLAEAKSEAKTEGRMDEALARLDAIEAELESIRDASDPRGKLQELDAAARQEQRLVFDLATLWKARLAQFVGIELPRTRVEMIKRVKEGKAQVANVGQLGDLEATAERADGIVSQYTDIISALPHKKLGANPSPPVAKAAAAFGQANAMLDAAMKTAKRLSGDPEGTNVILLGDLSKLELNWKTRARDLAAAFQKVGEEIRAAAADEPDTTNKEAAAAAATALARLPGHFRPDAFSPGIAVLVDKAAAGPAKLKAREAVLAVVRDYRQAIRNPLLIAATAGKDPYSRRLRPAVAMLEAALKKVELETLVAG